jgi:hypothetical protein
MIVQRGHHSERLADFSACADKHLDVAHDVTRGVYVGSMIASTFVGGPLAPLFTLALFTSGTLYGSMSAQMEQRAGAQISGDALLAASNGLQQDVNKPEGVKVALEFFERMVPVLMTAL